MLYAPAALGVCTYPPHYCLPLHSSPPCWQPALLPPAVLQGLPTDASVLDRVRALLKQWGAKTVMVSEDSSHAYHHVRALLKVGAGWWQ